MRVNDERLPDIGSAMNTCASVASQNGSFREFVEAGTALRGRFEHERGCSAYWTNARWYCIERE